MDFISHYNSRLGRITIASDGTHLIGLWFDGQKYFASTLDKDCEERDDLPVFEETRRWLDLYFAGKVPDFTPALLMRANDFRRRVWEILLTIPYGKTMTYGEIAQRIGKPRTTQAVGGAVGHNPISLIIPCHRVVGSDGSLTGYAGGIERKKNLLDMEKSHIFFETMNTNIERHPLEPFLPENAHLLFLGSFPPPKQRWCMDFYYPNFQNDHWRIEGAAWFNDRNYFVNAANKRFLKEKIVDFLNQKGIALYDTAQIVKRLKDNASDAFLEIVEPTDIRTLLQRIPQCHAIATTGEKATSEVCRQFGMEGIPALNSKTELEKGLFLYRLPSSSRAYPLAFEKKVAAYRAMFTEVFI